MWPHTFYHAFRSLDMDIEQTKRETQSWQFNGDHLIDCVCCTVCIQGSPNMNAEQSKY